MLTTEIKPHIWGAAYVLWLILTDSLVPGTTILLSLCWLIMFFKKEEIAFRNGTDQMTDYILANPFVTEQNN